MVESDRKAKMIIILGTNGTGKTTYVNNLLHYMLDVTGERSLVVTRHDTEWEAYPNNSLELAKDYQFSGIHKHFFRTGSWNKIVKFAKGTLVLDDCRMYIRPNLIEEVENLLISRRQKEFDIILVAHGFTQVPPAFFTFATEIILFKTTDNIQRRRDVLKDYDRVVKEQQEVNRKAEKNPHYKKIIKY